jgi:hypothetical protein
MDVDWQAIGQLLSGMLLGLGLFAWQKFIDWKKSRTSLAGSVARDRRINDTLIEIRTFYDADRVKLFQFHNGDHYVSGVSIMKLSLTHYALGRGVSVPYGAENDLLDIPLSHIDKIIEQITEKPFLYAEVKDLPDCYLTSLWRKGGTGQVLCRVVHNRRQEIIGFLVVSWLEPLSLTKEQLAMSKDLAALVSGEFLVR